MVNRRTHLTGGTATAYLGKKKKEKKGGREERMEGKGRRKKNEKFKIFVLLCRSSKTCNLCFELFPLEIMFGSWVYLGQKTQEGERKAPMMGP